MAACPLCNQLHEVFIHCSRCESNMQDKGRLMDYFDDYSAYLPIDMMKMSDGIAQDAVKEQCPHLFWCPACQIEQLELIAEEND